MIALCAPVSAFELRLKDEAHCPGSLVRLGDIAEMESPTTAGGPSLADLVLFPVPAAGKPRELNRQDLRQLLDLCGVDVREVELTGADVVVIHAGSVEHQTIVRPALHLIPASRYITTAAQNSEDKATAAKKPESPPKLVAHNQSVSIHSIWPGVEVTASGKALGGGALGESILVEQADSRQRVLAKVVGPQTVELRPTAK